MEDRQDITVPMPSEMVEAIEDQLTYGDSRAEWIREAVRMRLEAESTGGLETDGGEFVVAD